MKSEIKFLLACAIFGLWLTACGPVTAVPVVPTVAPSATITSTPKPTATITPSATPHPSSTPTSVLPALSASNGPEKDISAYQLRTWAEADSVHIVAGLDALVGDGEGQIPYDAPPNYTAAFELERLLKFPNSPNKMRAIGSLFLSHPATTTLPGVKLQSDLVAYYLQSILDQDANLENLVDKLEKNESDPLIVVVDHLMIENIAGQGTDGLVLILKCPFIINYDGLTAVYVIFPMNNQFRIEKIRDWQTSQAPAFGRDFRAVYVGDKNKNGLPEFVIDITAHSSGSFQHSSEDIDNYEWSGASGKFIEQTFPVFLQNCEGSQWGEGPCEGEWEFFQKGTQSVLSTKSFWLTQSDCPNLIIQTEAVWNGNQYVSSEPYDLLPDINLPLECRIAWADTAIRTSKQGWKKDLAISILETSLENWPTIADKWWGLAGRDYFKLRLGIWYELRGEGNKAVEILSQLANKPIDPKYDFAASMAALYLKEREKTNISRACIHLENAYRREFKKINIEPATGISDILNNWGFTNNGWKYSMGTLCDVYEFLPLDVRAAHLVSPKSLTEWLRKTGITIYQNESIDLNGDGFDDRLMLMDTTESESPDAWAFLSTPDGYQAAFIHDLRADNGSPKMKVHPVKIGDGSLAFLIALEKDLALFQVTKDLHVEILVEEYGVQSFDVKDEIAPAKVLINVDNYSDGKKTLTYVWDSASSNFIERDEFKIAQAEIEKLLYTEQDYTGTIAYIDKFLRARPQEPLQPYDCGTSIPGGCNYRPDWYTPYFRYLRGVAYEQLAQQQQAVQAFYELWRDYPKNVFGMVASLKLEPINP